MPRLNDNRKASVPVRMLCEAATATGGFKLGSLKALYDFSDDGTPEKLDLVQGAIYTLVEMGDDGWWVARDPTGREGLVPTSYVERCATPPTRHGSAPMIRSTDVGDGGTMTHGSILRKVSAC